MTQQNVKNNEHHNDDEYKLEREGYQAKSDKNDGATHSKNQHSSKDESHTKNSPAKSHDDRHDASHTSNKR